MPDREDRGRRSERESVERDRLERDLEETGARIEHPGTPDLSRAVRQRLEEEPAQRPSNTSRSWLPFSPRWAVAAAALVLVVALPLLSPGVRDTLSGISVGAGSAGSAASGGARGEAASGASGDSAASGARQGGVTASGAASGASSGGDLAATGAGRYFGAPLTSEQARERLDGRLLLPRALGEPEELYALDRAGTEGVAVVYLRREGMTFLGSTGAGLVLVEVPGDLGSMYPGERPGVEEITVAGGRGYWAPGPATLPPPLNRSVHSPANVLVWEQEGLVLRLESELSKGEAIRLAGSVR